MSTRLYILLLLVFIVCISTWLYSLCSISSGQDSAPIGVANNLVSRRLDIAHSSRRPLIHSIDSSRLNSYAIVNAPSKVFVTWDSSSSVPILVWTDDTGALYSATLNVLGEASKAVNKHELILGWQDSLYFKTNGAIFSIKSKIVNGQLEVPQFATIDNYRNFMLPKPMKGNIIAIADQDDYLSVITDDNTYISAYNCWQNKSERIEGISSHRIPNSLVGWHDGAYFVVDKSAATKGARYVRPDSLEGYAISKVDAILFDLVPISENPLVFYDLNNILWFCTGSLNEFIDGDSIKIIEKYVLHSKFNDVIKTGRLCFFFKSCAVVAWYENKIIYAESFLLSQDDKDYDY